MEEFEQMRILSLDFYKIRTELLFVKRTDGDILCVHVPVPDANVTPHLSCRKTELYLF
jgi:hypothetical protein